MNFARRKVRVLYNLYTVRKSLIPILSGISHPVPMGLSNMPALKMRLLTSFQTILLGFLLVILLGAALLALPAASKSGRGTPFLDAIFTATSALCVTGLVVRDTATYWSGFGKVVSLLLIQIGGLGVVTIATAFTRLAGKKIGLQLRSVLQESVAAPQIGGIIGYLHWILAVTLTVEAAGAFSPRCSSPSQRERRASTRRTSRK
ncbi:MAG: hypothetical protein E7425_04360 [Ruminococcaceae bacterium]|nr:hypothetical protein [Oscillospiraceae bacterium]